MQEAPAPAEAVVDEVMAEAQEGALTAEPGELNPLAASKSLGAEGNGEDCCH